METEHQHEDMLGRKLEIDSTVALNDYNSSLTLGKILRFTPKMVEVSVFSINRKTRKVVGSRKSLKYGIDLLLLGDADVTMFLLKNG